MTASPARRIAILASSGGNLRSHGGDDPAKLILDAKRQIEAAGFELVLAQFVAAGASMDSADDRTPAQRWTPSSPVPTPACPTPAVCWPKTWCAAAIPNC